MTLTLTLTLPPTLIWQVRSVSELEQVSTLVKLLDSTVHNGFPVFASGARGSYAATSRSRDLGQHGALPWVSLSTAASSVRGGGDGGL